MATQQNGSPPRRGGEKKEGQFCHQRGGDPRIHHQHSQAHPWSGLQEVCSSGTQRNSEVCHEGNGDTRCVHWPRLNKAIWAKGIRNVPYHIQVCLSRKCNEDEDSPNKLCTGNLRACYHIQKSTDGQCGWELTCSCQINLQNWKKKRKDLIGSQMESP